LPQAACPFAADGIAADRKIANPAFSVHETCLRQGMDLWKFMHDAVLAWIANTAPPSMMPRPPAPVPSG
jgi:hypothetical protein